MNPIAFGQFMGLFCVNCPCWQVTLVSYSTIGTSSESFTRLILFPKRECIMVTQNKLLGRNKQSEVKIKSNKLQLALLASSIAFPCCCFLNYLHTKKTGLHLMQQPQGSQVPVHFFYLDTGPFQVFLDSLKSWALDLTGNSKSHSRLRSEV